MRPREVNFLRALCSLTLKLGKQRLSSKLMRPPKYACRQSQMSQDPHANTTTVDILYVEGPGNIVDSFRTWNAGVQDLRITSTTFSGQVFEFCRRTNLSLYAVSYCGTRDIEYGTNITVVNIPRRTLRIPKVGYVCSVWIYSLRLLLLALRIRPKIIFICSGVIAWNSLAILRLSGSKLAPVLHNTLWPERTPTTRSGSAGIGALTAWAWKQSVDLVLAVSPAAARQAENMVRAKVPVLQFRPTFRQIDFAATESMPIHRSPPFRIMFAGRIEEDKGVFDLLEMASILKERRRGIFEFTICGGGHRLVELKNLRTDLGLTDSVRILGPLERPALIEQYRKTHIVVVPTKGSFCEGYAMVVAEALLMLAPVITSSVVPSAELFPEAVMLAVTDEPESYVNLIEEVSSNAQRYDLLVEGARKYRTEILRSDNSFESALSQALENASFGISG